MIIQSYYRLLSSAETRRRKKLELKKQGKSTKSKRDQWLLDNPTQFSSLITDSTLGLVIKHDKLIKPIWIGSCFKDALKLYKDAAFKNNALLCAKLEDELLKASIALSTLNTLPNSFKNHTLKGKLAGLGELHLFNRNSDTLLLYDYKVLDAIDSNTKETLNIKYALLYAVVSHELLDNPEFQKSIWEQRKEV